MSAQNRDSGSLLKLPLRGSSNVYPQSLFFWSKGKKNCVYPCKYKTAFPWTCYGNEVVAFLE